MKPELDIRYFYISQAFYDLFQHIFKGAEIIHVDSIPANYCRKPSINFDYYVKAPAEWYESLDDTDRFFLEGEKLYLWHKLVLDQVN